MNTNPDHEKNTIGSKMTGTSPEHTPTEKDNKIPIPKTIFSLTKEQALQSFHIKSVLEEWELYRFRRGYITWWMMLFTRLVGALPILGLSYFLKFLADMAHTHKTPIPTYTLLGPGNTLMILLWYVALFTLPISFLYAVITGFLYRKKDHIKYKFHTYLYITYLTLLVFLQASAFALMAIPDLFPYCQDIFTAVILALTVYQFHIQLRRYRTELVDQGNPRKETNAKYRYFVAFMAALYPLFRFSSPKQQEDMTNIVYGFFFFISPLLLPIVLPFITILDLVYILPYFYLVRYPEEFRLSAGKTKAEWYGPYSVEAQEEKNRVAN